MTGELKQQRWVNYITKFLMITKENLETINFELQLHRRGWVFIKKYLTITLNENEDIDQFVSEGWILPQETFAMTKQNRFVNQYCKLQTGKLTSAKLGPKWTMWQSRQCIAPWGVFTYPHSSKCSLMRSIIDLVRWLSFQVSGVSWEPRSTGWIVLCIVKFSSFR